MNQRPLFGFDEHRKVRWQCRVISGLCCGRVLLFASRSIRVGMLLNELVRGLSVLIRARSVLSLTVAAHWAHLIALSGIEVRRRVVVHAESLFQETYLHLSLST